MELWKSISGMIRVELTCADPSTALAAIEQAGITVYHVRQEEDGITVSFSVHRNQRNQIDALAQKKGYALRILRHQGLYWAARGLRKRPVLVAGILLLLMLSFYVPSRVFFVRVEGNLSVPTRLILEKSEACGIYFGASRKAVRSEQVKNSLLESIEQLQWVGVNTSGCVAVISVRERPIESTESVQGTGVSSIVALRDGVITRCTVTQGNRLCKVGQVVRQGQLLVSGYTDCGISIQAGSAEAEIYAQTQHQLQAVLPVDRNQKNKNSEQVKKYSVVIGKKRINLYKGSGILGSSCDKMYSENYMTLPGGYRLPICIVTEVWTEYSQTQVQIPQEQASQMLSAFARMYLPSQMTAGCILTAQESSALLSGAMVLEGEYACEEMIAQVRSEENLIPNGKYD